MINSFWNICSTCPMPKEEKLNSEYTRNFVWHPTYKALPQDVVTGAPQPGKEMAMQRKKQYPDLAYRTHEVIAYDTEAMAARDSADLRARSEERERGISAAPKSGPRSRSAEPSMERQHQKLIMVQSYPPMAPGRGTLLPQTEEHPKQNEAGGLPKTTEYRSQYAWPRKSDLYCTPRKSISMGLIKGASDQPALPQRPQVKLEPMAHTVRPCAKEKDVVDKSLREAKRKNKTEYKSKYKPFTSYVYVDGQWKKTSRLVKVPEKPDPEVDPNPWYTEVMERLKKANEYRWRGQGHPVYGPKIYGEPVMDDGPSLMRNYKETVEVPAVHLPRISETKKTEAKVKEKSEKSTSERKREKEKRVQGAITRPKSAEPAKAKEDAKGPNRPATTPPIRPHSVHHSRKSPKKDELAEKRAKPSSRSTFSRRPKEESHRASTAPGGSRGSKLSPQQQQAPRSGGKVWLQAGAPVSTHPAVESTTVEHSDAVRPSSLLPPGSRERHDTTLQNGIAEEAEEEVLNKAPGDGPGITGPVVPLTNVKTPEEVTGVKSPDPEFWTVPMDTGQKLEWSESSAAVDSPTPQPKPSMSTNTEKAAQSEGLNELTMTSPTSDDSALQRRLQQEPPVQPPTPSRMNTADVLDRARSRLDQFWGKSK